MKAALAVSAALAGIAALPAQAQEMRPGEASVLYYISIPVDAATRREKEPALGFALQGRRTQQALRFDTRMMNFVDGGILEAKWLIVGAVAAGGAVAVTRKDKAAVAQQNQAREAQVQRIESGTCPVTPNC